MKAGKQKKGEARELLAFLRRRTTRVPAWKETRLTDGICSGGVG